MGDTVHIQEELDGWFFGYSLQNSASRGVFPKSFIRVSGAPAGAGEGGGGGVGVCLFGLWGVVCMCGGEYLLICVSVVTTDPGLHGGQDGPRGGGVTAPSSHRTGGDGSVVRMGHATVQTVPGEWWWWWWCYYCCSVLLSSV